MRRFGQSSRRSTVQHPDARMTSVPLVSRLRLPRTQRGPRLCASLGVCGSGRQAEGRTPQRQRSFRHDAPVAVSPSLSPNHVDAKACETFAQAPHHLGLSRRVRWGRDGLLEARLYAAFGLLLLFRSSPKQLRCYLQSFCRLRWKHCQRPMSCRESSMCQHAQAP
jgi:hypothetical protein